MKMWGIKSSGGERGRVSRHFQKPLKNDPFQNLTMLADLYMQQGLHEDAQALQLRVVQKVMKGLLEQRAFHGGSWSSNPVGSGWRESIPQNPGGIGACGAPCRHEARCQSGDGHHDECRPERQRIARADVVQEISK
jgi:hypothetical protein